jgi:putative tricarboxylic transport membrane protein
MKINDVLSGCCIGGFGAAIFMHARAFPPMVGQNVGPNLFPQIIGAGLLVCAALLILRGVKALATEPSQPWITLPDWLRQRRIVLGFVLVPLALLFYVAVSETLGFILSAFLLLIALFLVFAVRPRTALLVAVLGALGIHAVFYMLLRVPLPWGVLEPFAW